LKKLIFSLLLLLPLAVSALFPVEGTVKDLSLKRVYLMSIYGERTVVIDSVTSDSAGRFRFVFPDSRLPGMYRVMWSKEGHVDVIWNREAVSFSTTQANPADSLLIISSLENRLYLFYSRIDRLNQARLELLLPVVDFYPVKDAFYTGAARELEAIQRSQEATLDSIDKAHPGSYAVRIFKVYRTPFIPANMNQDVRGLYLKQHYLDRVDFNDTALLRSMAYANKAISYLSLYSNNRMPQKQLEAEFIRAVTALLSAASVNPQVFKFLLDYLVGGFDKYHFDEVITYMADNFQDPFACEDQARKSALQKKLETFKKIALGKVAPPLEMPDVRGKMVNLESSPSEYTLLVFWSTECSHCTDMMPRLKALYDNQKPRRWEVMAIALDTSRTEWNAYVKEEKLNWINLSDLKGFSGKAADDYNIYATPTMFLLDRDRKIIAKPISYRELEQDLRNNKLIR
jgi:peroxiredoxin